MALDGTKLKNEILAEMKKNKNLSKVKDSSGNDINLNLDQLLGEFMLALANAIVKHITKNAVLNTDAKTIM